MKRLAILALPLAIAACDTPHPGPKIPVVVDGYRINVQEDLRPEVNSWFAVHAIGQGAGHSGEVFSRNLRAIEAASGCSVMPTSISNNSTGAYSTAAVDCE